MSDDPKNATDDAPANTKKDPHDWVTGDETMTGAQASYLKYAVRGGRGTVRS